MNVVVGLGANLGDRLATLQAATEALGRIAPITLVSSVYESAPVGGPPQPDFLNGAVLVTWDRDLLLLLDELQAIENTLGRVRGERWGPRVIDLDILWAEGAVLDSPRLIVPHPRLTERAFALTPLLEVCPECVDPRTEAPFVAPVRDRTNVVFCGALRG
jgi:2-amino-4-hydroxy-6-hydroxymethyldihydropteridine diphosphokinase